MKKILIIEDEQDLQNTYRDKLKREGFLPISAYTGEEGIKKAKMLLPDLIILDLMLPGGPDGYVVLSQLKNDE